jgi:signal transduction histidine kinase/CheY-like chemotaxis protein
METLEKALTGETIAASRFQFNIPKTRRLSWVSNINAPLRNTQGKIIGVIGTMRDITDHVRSEEQLRHSQKMEAVGTLTGGIAHDFNHILNVILGYGNIVMDDLEAGSPVREQMNEVITSAERASLLVKKLLSFSRKQISEFKPVKINDIILNFQKMLVRILHENITLNLDLSKSRLIVMADSVQIEQVMMNLATNARDAMPEGGYLTIGTGSQEIDDEFISVHGYGIPGIYALMTVSDTGHGMDTEIQEKIFDPFFTSKGIESGTGLGLSISYGIIKQHKGYIIVYSKPGEGTLFKIYIPLTDEPSVIYNKTSDSDTLRRGNETILVAEDDDSLRNLTRIILESFGYSVITAENGEDAIIKFRENREEISLVILDMIMPKKSGKEAYEEIRIIDPGIKALLMSGYTLETIDTGNTPETGFYFIHKPFLPKDLVNKVNELLDNGGIQDA